MGAAKHRDPAQVAAVLGTFSDTTGLPASTVDVVAFFAFREYLSKLLYASFRLPDRELLLIHELKTRLAARTLSVDDVATMRTALLRAQKRPETPPVRVTAVCVPNPFALRSRDAIRNRFAEFPLSEGRRLAERASRFLLHCGTCQTIRTDQHGATNVQIDASVPSGFVCSLCGEGLQAFDAVEHLIQPTGAHGHHVVSPCCGTITRVQDIAFSEETPIGLCTGCTSSKSNGGREGK